jgi:diketogulonate reductase-like aldo/keto reductase
MVPFAAKLVLVGCELPITHQRTAGTFPVVESVAADLKQIGVDYVDLMLLHWSCDTMEQTVAHYKLMQDLVKPSLAADGSYAAPLAKAIGISNFNASAIESLMAAPGVTVKPAVNQVRSRSSDRDVTCGPRPQSHCLCPCSAATPSPTTTTCGRASAATTRRASTA